MKKKFSFIPWIFPKLLTPKNAVTWMLESSSFRTPFGSQCAHGLQTLLKLSRQHFYPDFLIISEQRSSKKSLIVISEIVGLFSNMSTAYHTYSRQNWEKLPQQVEAKLYSNHEIVFQIFILFFKATLKLSHFLKKVQLYTLNIIEVIDFEECGYFNP